MERASLSPPHSGCQKPVSGVFLFFNTSEIASEFELSFIETCVSILKLIRGQYLLQLKYFIFNFVYYQYIVMKSVQRYWQLSIFLESKEP